MKLGPAYSSASERLSVSGSCHCGAIGFKASVDPASVSICHCTDCQTLSGTAYRVSVPAARDDFHLTRGTPRIYIKIADSGARRAQAFCASCGTPIYASAAEEPQVFNLRVGAIHERAQLTPRRQIWCASAQPWCADLGPLPGSARA